MSDDDLARWRGLGALVADAVEHGSRAVEQVQKEVARRPFAVLEAIPALAAPARAVHGIHDASVAAVHGALRLATRAARAAAALGLEAMRD